MNYPFYRCADYLNDWLCRYQCLNCGETIDVSDYYPNFCCNCGIKYNGYILPKRIEYISLPNFSKFLFKIETAYEWGDGDELVWHEVESYYKNSKDVIKQFKELKKEEQNKRGKRIFRIKASKEEQNRQNIAIDLNKYYKRTGNHFNKRLYERI